MHYICVCETLVPQISFLSSEIGLFDTFLLFLQELVIIENVSHTFDLQKLVLTVFAVIITKCELSQDLSTEIGRFYAT